MKNHRPKEFIRKALILGVKIDNRPLSWFLQKAEEILAEKKPAPAMRLFFTPNPEICLRAANDGEYRDVLNGSIANLPDGYGLRFGAKILDEELNERATGADFTVAAVDLAVKKNWRLFFLLRQDSLTTPERLRAFLTKTYPKLSFDLAVMDHRGNSSETLLRQINSFSPDLLFVCFGAPEQELWLAKNKSHLNSVGMGIGVGGAIDFLTGAMSRAPKLVRDWGLEWSYRLLKEPQRLARIKRATADFLLTCRRWHRRIATEFRPNVLIIIKNKEGKYLIQKSTRFIEHWQFPQGGVDSGESLIDAAYREAKEELGIKSIHLNNPQTITAFNEYIWPDYAQKLKGFRGQRQQPVVFEFTGSDEDIHPEDGQEAEIFRWVEKSLLRETIHADRRGFLERIWNKF